MIAVFMAAALVASGAGSAQAAPVDDPLTRPLPGNPDWLKPQTPVRVYGNTYYVGSAALSIVLIDTGDGLILIDGALPQSVATIEANIRQVGFRIEDVRYILNTEAHYDHSGGLAALARDSGAPVLTSPIGAAALRAGKVPHDDPQASNIEAFPPVVSARGIGDGEIVKLGKVTVRAVYTPGHTPGSVSWTWETCGPQGCKAVVFASSLNAVAAAPFTYAGHADVTARLRTSIDRIDALKCDILISAHPDNSGGVEKLAGVVAGVSPNPFLDPNACRAYATRARGVLDGRLAREARP